MQPSHRSYPDVHTHDELTQQEAQVARLAAHGMSRWAPMRGSTFGRSLLSPLLSGPYCFSAPFEVAELTTLGRAIRRRSASTP